MLVSNHAFKQLVKNGRAVASTSFFSINANSNQFVSNPGVGMGLKCLRCGVISKHNTPCCGVLFKHDSSPKKKRKSVIIRNVGSSPKKKRKPVIIRKQLQQPQQQQQQHQQEHDQPLFFRPWGVSQSGKKNFIKIFFFQDSELNALDLGSAVLSDDFDRSNFIFRPAVTFLLDPDIEKKLSPGSDPIRLYQNECSR